MANFVTCEQCKMEIRLARSHFGKQIACPNCKFQFVAPFPQENKHIPHRPSAPTQPTYAPPPVVEFTQPQQHATPPYTPPITQAHYHYHESRPYSSHSSAPQVNSGISAVLSFIWTGAGNIYNGNIGKGLMICLVQIVLIIFAAFTCIGLPLALIFWAWGIYDAHREAEEINRRNYGRRY